MYIIADAAFKHNVFGPIRLFYMVRYHPHQFIWVTMVSDSK